MKERIQYLVKQLNIYRNAYYNESKSLVSDYEYDELYDELKKLENETGIIYSNSPTQSVGYEVVSKLQKVKHSHPMLSLAKTKSANDLVTFSNGRDCVLSLKMDGLTTLMTYDFGSLIQAETRGNGEIGEIITHNAKVFENLPSKIHTNSKIEFEGESIITKSDFELINNKLPEDEKYKNCRNLVSGSVRQLDSRIAKKRHIKFIVWKVPYSSASYTSGFKFAKQLGFEVVPYVKYNSNTDNIDEKIAYLKVIAEEKGYACPICGEQTQIIKDNESEVLICSNPDCPGKLLGKISHAVSRNALNIDGLSDATIEKFISLGWLKSISDIYFLKKYEKNMQSLSGFGKKSVDKLLASIEISRKTELNRFINALSIPMIGNTASKTIAKYCDGSVDKFFTGMNEKFPYINIEGIGTQRTEIMHDFWNNHKEEVKSFAREFVFEETGTSNTASNNLESMIFVITGRYIEESKKYQGIINSKSQAPCGYLIYDGNIKRERIVITHDNSS